MKRLFVFVFMVFVHGAVMAEPIDIRVRVLANDAKFIGTAMGGARIVITDFDTGGILASGITRGGTGDTALIMRKPRERGVSIVTDNAAVFRASVDITKPTRVRVMASGPLDYPDSTAQVSETRWLIPGHDIEDGWTLSMPGFVLVPQDIPVAVTKGNDIPVRVKLVMMCGCPTEPGGLWNADHYSMMGQLWDGDRLVAEHPLSYTGHTSYYQTVLPAIEPGELQVLVYAVDDKTGNSAVIKAPVLVGQ